MVQVHLCIIDSLPFQDIVLSLEAAHMDHMSYREALQDLDKWILQTSFRLMAHNALNVSTKEHAQAEIQKHQVRSEEF